jgi:gliding motility-associated-like protein
MQKKFTFLIILSALLLSIDAFAQSVRRSVISSMGASEQVSGATIRSTVGQPPNAGTIFTADNYLRQGFQQPSSCVTAPKAAFAIDVQGNAVCGGPYQFFYMDDPREETTFYWQFGQGSMPDTSVVKDPTDVTYLSTGYKTVSLSVATGACVDTASLNLDVLFTPVRAELATMDLLCLEDADGGIDLFVEGGTEPYQVNWSHGGSGISQTDLLPGLYSFTITDINNCKEEGEAEIYGPADSLQIDVAVTDESCHGNQDGMVEVIASGGTSPYTFDWPDGTSAQSVSQLSAGIYTLTVSDDNNCLRIEPIVVEVACEALKFYDVITPNGDGQNDMWVIESLHNFPANQLILYDRWGRQVYEQTGYANDWQGTGQDGKPLPFGTYYFVMKLNDESGAIYTGAISIVR